MKKAMFFILSLFFLYSSSFIPHPSCYAQEAKIIAFDGNVEAKITKDADWAPAQKDMEISEGGTIRTNADGSAVILMPNKSKIWMKESSHLDIEQRQKLVSRLGLFFGKIKARVPHLLRKEKFEVRTPAAVCAVRGTEFTMSTTEEGQMNMEVLYGEVKLDYIVPPAKGAARLEIPQGHSLDLEEKGKQGKLALLSQERENAALENWAPGLKPEERRMELKERLQERHEIREFAKVAQQTENTVKNFLQTVKESDIEAGRTLTDVHGNLVRVDQRLVRPDGKTLQFYNLVKRPVYNYRNVSFKGGFTNNSEKGKSRLDLFQMNMAFNTNIPDRIEDWPGFFDQNSVRAEKASFISANKTDSSNIFLIAQLYKYQSANDELVNDQRVLGRIGESEEVVLMGNLTGAGALADYNKIAKVDIYDAVKNPTGLKGEIDGGISNLSASNANTPSNFAWATRADAPLINGGTNSYEYIKPVESVLYDFHADAYQIGELGGTGDYVWLAREDYVINNSGKIRQLGDFINTSQDPFSLLKETAIQSIMYVKQDADNYEDGSNDHWTTACIYQDISTNDYFGGKNIDLVFIPDLGVAAIQKLLPAVQELNK